MVLLLSMIGFLVACGNGDDEQTETPETPGTDTEETPSTDEGAADAVDLTAWAWDPNFNIRALNYAKDYYDGDIELNLELIENAQDDIIQRLNTGLSSGTTQGMPNIVLIEDYRAQSFLQSYPDAFYPITDYIDSQDFAEYKIEATSYDGEVFGLPFDTGVTGLYVRVDYLEEAGFTFEDIVDVTWEEYIEIGKVVKEETGKDMLTLDPNDFGMVRVMLQSAGSWYFEEDGQTPNLADNPALAESFEMFKALLDANIVKLNSDWSQFVGAFNSGDVATVPTGNWITPSVKAEDSQSGDWRIAPIPRLTVEGATHASNLGGSSFYVLNQDGKEAAATFLSNTFGNNLEFYDTLITEMGAIGTYLPGLESEAYDSEDEFFGGQQVYRQFTEWTEEIPAVVYGMHTYAIDDILVVEMQNFLNGQDIDTVLERAQAQAETQLR